jgi:hypothetical protein
MTCWIAKQSSSLVMSAFLAAFANQTVLKILDEVSVLVFIRKIYIIVALGAMQKIQPANPCTPS